VGRCAALCRAALCFAGLWVSGCGRQLCASYTRCRAWAQAWGILSGASSSPPACSPRRC
jgi:hypothetical protein